MLGLRLSFGLMTLLALLISVGGYAIWLFLQMNAAVENVLQDNYECVKALHSSRVAAARINSTYISDEWPAPLQADRSFFTDNVDTMDRNLQTLKSNILDAEGSQLVKRFEFAVRDYQAQFNKMFTLRPDQGKEYAQIRKQVGSANLLMTELGEQLLKLYEGGMFKAQQHAEGMSVQSIWFMVLAIMLAV